MVAFLFHPTSYLGIVIFLVLTGCGMPIPEEVAIVLAGVLSAEGHLLLLPALAACLIGAILGDSIMYGIGYRWGRGLLRVSPRLAWLLEAEHQERFQDQINRHGFKVLCLSRFMVGVRGPVYVAAGAVRMPYRRFLFYDVISATLTVGLFFTVAYIYGEEVADWIKSAEWTVTIVVAILLLAVGGYLYFRHRQHLFEKLFGPPPETEADA